MKAGSKLSAVPLIDVPVVALLPTRLSNVTQVGAVRFPPPSLGLHVLFPPSLGLYAVFPRAWDYTGLGIRSSVF